MGQISFTHNQAGTLVIDNGIDDARWGYNLNSATFPTYGGEVVQILSVYVDDLTLIGTITTYEQMETIYNYFSRYLQVATQGKTPNPGHGDTGGGIAYNVYPVYFAYPDRHWYIKIYPKSIPGFRYARDMVAPTWQINAHVIDDSADLDLIKNGIKALATKQLINGLPLSLGNQISPEQGNPDTDPFETYTPFQSQAGEVIKRYADYYNSLLPDYQRGDFSAITGGIGAQPNVNTLPTNPPTPPTIPTPPSTQIGPPPTVGHRSLS